LRNWVQQAEIDEGHRPGVTSEDAKRIAELERENRELRRAKGLFLLEVGAGQSSSDEQHAYTLRC
jgi:transposase-like protein